MTTRPSIDAERLWDDIMALGAITEPDRPYTRRSFSPLFMTTAAPGSRSACARPVWSRTSMPRGT